MKHASTLRLYRCWAALKGRTPAPARADLRPHLLGSAMLDIFTLRHERFVFGYAGSRLRASLSMKFDDLDFPSIWRAGDKTDVARLLRGIITHNRPVMLGARRSNSPRTSEPAELLLLPTIEPSGERGIVGALAAGRDWFAGASDNVELALAVISTPDKAIEQEGSRTVPQPMLRPLRPRLLASPAAIGRPRVEMPAR